jgi:hypothetical protein
LDTTKKRTNISIDAEGHPHLILSLPADKEEEEALEDRGPGIYEVAFWIERGRESGSVRTPYGKILWVPRM